MDDKVTRCHERACRRPVPFRPVMSDTLPVQSDDFDALLELLEEETMRDVIALFVASAPTRLESARAGLESGDAARTATAFHTLRSGCGQLGARRLEALCAAGEHAAKHGDVAGAGERLREAHVEYSRCLEWFQAHGWLRA